MKFIQSDNQIQVKSSGVGQFITGLIFLIIGLALAGLGISGKVSNSSATSSPHTGLILILFGLASLVIGGLVMAFSSNQLTTIVKGGDTTIGAKRLLGGHQTQQSFPTATIVKVRLVTYLQMNTAGPSTTNSPNQRTSKLSLALQNNDEVVLAEKGGNGGLSINGMNVSSLVQKAPLGKEADQLATFLGVPLEASDSSTLAGAVKTIKDAFTGDSAVPTQPAATPTFAATPPPTTMPSAAPTFVTPQAQPQYPTEPTPPAPPSTPSPPESETPNPQPPTQA